MQSRQSVLGSSSHGAEEVLDEDDLPQTGRLESESLAGPPTEWSGSEGPRREPMRRGMLGCAPTTENIVIWASARILHREELLMVEPGRFFYSGVPQNVDQRLHEMLRPIFQHIHRDDHTERRAFLTLCRAIVKRVGYDGIVDVSGCVGMYIAHFPCISCVAVICQFIRFFPCVRLDMDFDNMWKTRWKYGFHRDGLVQHQYQGVRSLAQKP